MPKHSKKHDKATEQTAATLELTPVEPTADSRYPIGKPAIPEHITAKEINAAIEIIAEMPKKLDHALRKLNDKKLDTPYREGGWTVRQLVHHIADSHMIAFIRVRKALTEDTPLVTDYDQQLFAELADSAAPVEVSLALIENVHVRWVMMLRSMTEEQFARRYNTMKRGLQSIANATLIYAWHSRHHVAHITALRKQKDW
jgi:uncharacterized damage-inducible protein DinB